ncbi:phosphoribosyltransferase family protein [Massilia niabensis]|uniref:Phosphoribosyltransferase family protein n=1 Tax=Massilia niabensis TaxID=544910 RepID=A0ABW0L170_9BURK
MRWPPALTRRLVNALLPCSCALCGELAAHVVCVHCRERYAAPGGLRCACCANPLGPAATAGQRCGGCLAEPPAFDATVAAVDYGAPLDALVRGLKFGAQLPLAPWFGQLLRDAVLMQPGMTLPEVLCPVPLGPRRLRERGFNQALEIARPLAKALAIELQPRLAARVVETVAQSGVAPRERAGNIRGAFAVPPAMAHLVHGRHVGIVDDVMTSGHTLNALAAALKAAGAARVSNLVFARTPPS